MPERERSPAHPLLSGRNGLGLCRRLLRCWDADHPAARDPGARANRLRRLTAVLAEAPILKVDRTVAAHYGELRAVSGSSATNDLWIAATALAHGLALCMSDRGQAALPLVQTTLID